MDIHHILPLQLTKF